MRDSESSHLQAQSGWWSQGLASECLADTELQLWRMERSGNGADGCPAQGTREQHGVRGADPPWGRKSQENSQSALHIHSPAAADPNERRPRGAENICVYVGARSPNPC